DRFVILAREHRDEQAATELRSQSDDEVETRRWHVEIDEHGVRRPIDGHRKRGWSIVRGAHLVAAARERFRDRTAHGLVVIDDEDAIHHDAADSISAPSSARRRSTARQSSWHTRDGVIFSVSAIS